MSTLKQIAAAAGVHLTTVAAILNGAGGNTRAGESTRRRVMIVAKRLGYLRNESAWRLRTGKSNMIGFIGGDLRNPFFAELASALECEADAAQFQLVISHVSPSGSTTVAQAIEQLRRQTITRIILWDEASDSVDARDVKSFRLVSIGFRATARPGIWLDLQHAMRLVVESLVRRKFRRLGFYAPRGQQESPSVTIRAAMFIKACHSLGLAKPVLAEYAGESWDLEAAVSGARRLAGLEKTQAFVGFNDVAALGLLMADSSRKPQPPVVCFDGTALARSWPGRPMYLDLKIGELARRAVQAAMAEKGCLSGARRDWIKPKLGG